MFSSHNVLGFSSFLSSGLVSAGFVSSGLGAWPYAGAFNATPRITAVKITPSRRVIRSSSGVRLRCRRALAVADATGLGGHRDQRDDLVHETVGDDDLHLHLGQEVDGIFAAAVHFGVTLLPAEAPDLAHGHADDAGARERLLHVVQLERLDDRLDLLHLTFTASAREPSTSWAASPPMCPSRGR